MANKLNINVTVEGIQLPLQVANPDEEKLYRDAATAIQQRVKRLRDTFPSLPNEKYYYVMAMLNTSVEAIKTANKASTEPYTEMMRDLEREMADLGL